MAKELTWKEAINQVLEQHPSGLHYGDITDKILEQKLKSFIGATPSATVNSQIASSIKNDGDASPYVRIDKGVFALKPELVFSSQHSSIYRFSRETIRRRSKISNHRVIWYVLATGFGFLEKQP
jgi:hypothetical protein